MPHPTKLPLALVLVALLAARAVAQEGRDGPWMRMDYGPFLSAAVEAPHPGGNMTRKGIAIPLRDGDAQLSVLFDMELLRYSACWEEGFLEMRGVVFDGSHGTFPRIEGRQLWGTSMLPGWSRDGRFEDPRAVPFGPLPEADGDWRGLHLHDDEVMLCYRVGATSVFEVPELVTHDGMSALARNLILSAVAAPLTLELVHEPGAAFERFAHGRERSTGGATFGAELGVLARDRGADPEVIAAGVITSGHPQVRWLGSDGHLRLELGQSIRECQVKVIMARLRRSELPRFAALCQSSRQLETLEERMKGQARRWSRTLETEGRLDAGSDSLRLRVAVPAHAHGTWLRVQHHSGRKALLRSRDGARDLGESADCAGSVAVLWDPPPDSQPTLGEEQLADRLLGYWPMDEGHGDAATDLSARHRTITIELPSWRRGYRGRSLEFEGRTRARVDAEVDFRDGDLTVSAWLMCTSDGTILAKTAPRGPWVRDGKTLFVRDGKLSYDIGWVGYVESRSRVDDGKWHHAALTYEAESGTVTLYVDGVPEARKELRPREKVTDHVVRLGFTAENFPQTSWLNGRIDELRIHQRLLSAPEIEVLAGAHLRRPASVFAANAPGARWRAGSDGLLEVSVPASFADDHLEILHWSGRVESAAAACENIAELLQEPGKPYIVDRISWPDDNPWRSWMRFGGFDFFSDPTRAAICTWSGDVWTVAGLDDDLSGLEWRRIATGLHQPLGLRIVDDQIYVLGRDQITRLVNRDADPEIEHYECFNDDCMNHEHFHEFCMDLQTDAQGRFYFMKGARHGLRAAHPHHGTLRRVSADGRRSETLAWGFRAPNGLALSLDGRRHYTTDQEGHWMPANRLNAIETGGFHGNCWSCFPAAEPSTYQPPLCWIHPSVDRSPSAPVIVDSERWGMPRGTLLCLSYGIGQVFRVLQDEVDGVAQGAITPLPFTIPTGIMRARFNPRDGQLYVCGLFGWSSDVTEPGGFYRLRYSGAPRPMPEAFHVEPDGIAVTFNVELDPEVARDPECYHIESWDYRWTEKYGSPQLRADGREGRDRREIEAIRLSEDGKTVHLRLARHVPVMQLHVKLDVMGREGEPIKTFIHGTINKVPRR